jgi:hypothetical protein
VFQSQTTKHYADVRDRRLESEVGLRFGTLAAGGGSRDLDSGAGVCYRRMRGTTERVVCVCAFFEGTVPSMTEQVERGGHRKERKETRHWAVTKLRERERGKHTLDTSQTEREKWKA